MRFIKTGQKLRNNRARTVIIATSAKEQGTRVIITKNFRTQILADTWYTERVKTILHCLRELEDACKGG